MISMPQSMHDYVVESLYGVNINDVQRDTKISKWTLLKIRQRQIENPGIKSIETLYHYLKLREAKLRRART